MICNTEREEINRQTGSKKTIRIDDRSARYDVRESKRWKR